MNLPLYPQSRPIDMADKALFDELFFRLQPRVSEFTFANLYLFRRAHDYAISSAEGSVVVVGKSYRGERYFLPPFGAEPRAALLRLLGEGLTMYGADDAFVGEYLAVPGMEILEDRDSFDYVYHRAALAELSGNRYHRKKNRVNYFASRHEYVVEPFGPHHEEGCRALVREWLRVRGALESPSMVQEAEAAAEAVSLAGALGLQGVVVLVGGEPKAFSLGELLNDDTSVCHFEKADPFLEGLYQLVNREFCRLLFTGCTYVNREQDLGEANLRETKLSYHPVDLVRKHLVRIP